MDKILTLSETTARLLEVVNELKLIPVGRPIHKYNELLFVARLPEHISITINVPKDTDVYISRMALKHLIDRRKSKAEHIVRTIPCAIMKPLKIVDNSRKRKDSFLFFYTDRLVVCVVLEKTKTTRDCQVVSAFPVHPKIYKKMIDISGRAEFPPFELPS